MTNFQRDLFSERAFLKLMALNFVSYIVKNSVCDYLLPYLKQNPKKKMFYKKGVPKTFAKLTGKHMCQSLFFNKAAGLRPATLKKRIWHSCFPVNFAKFFRTTSEENTLGRLLLSSNPISLDKATLLRP